MLHLYIYSCIFSIYVSLHLYIANFLSFSTFFSWRLFPTFPFSDYPEITKVNDKIKKKT